MRIKDGSIKKAAESRAESREQRDEGRLKKKKSNKEVKKKVTTATEKMPIYIFPLLKRGKQSRWTGRQCQR